jgi:hypothetical protein
MKSADSRQILIGCVQAALALGSGLATVEGYAADRLVVKDGGANVKFIVRDTGIFGAGVSNPVYPADVSSSGAASSQLHFVMDGAGTAGGWLTSVLDNNFFVSSGAVYLNGNWTQKSSDTNAVIAGSGSLGYRVFTNTGKAVDTTFVPTVRLHIDYNGNIGINATAVAGVPITTGTGATLTAGGAWQNASSRALKENIEPLSKAQAFDTLAVLAPVTFNYKADQNEKHVGFIAEDVPDLVASPDRKTLGAMDVVAVLTKVVQEQRQALEEQRAKAEKTEQRLSELSAQMERLLSERR